MKKNGLLEGTPREMFAKGFWATLGYLCATALYSCIALVVAGLMALCWLVLLVSVMQGG